MRARFFLFLILFLLAASSFAATAEETEEPELGKSAVPFVVYDDKRGWQFGGAGFLYTDKEPGINSGFFVISNLNNFHSAGLTYDQRSLGPWSYTLTMMAEKGFDNYYGEGDQTSALSHVFISQYHFEGKPGVLYRVLPHFRLGISADLRSRQENETQFFPNETSVSPGLLAQWDTRDKLINTRRGDFIQLSLSRNLSDLGFSQADLDLRHFTRLRRDLTFGSHVAAGFSVGQPSYLFRYRLGGLHLLRGYKDNRFRGSKFFVAQEELRWFLKKWLSVNASIDTGDIGDEVFHQLKLTGQLGLRLGLPPGWSQKMRMDFGMGIDQMTFQIQFGELF